MAATEHQKVAHFIGGNSLDVAPPGRVRDFVKEHGGHTVITKVLIANNGIAAVKEIRSVRQWSYETFGSERAIEFTVMATPEDLKVNAEYIRMADRYVEVPGGTNNNNYANVDFIVDVAERSGVHAVAEKIGYPVMIKASEGGGGKGIRKVESPETFKNAFGAVAGEVPGSPIFIMKLAGSARHLEVQLLADQYGNAISLFGRDCSVQRRHQKIIEEAPVTIATPDVFEEMEKAAVRLSKLVGYVSAGTVEYLYSPADNTFCFLELNPRLQVEHPTTEIVSGVNLPAAQLQVAMGLPLHRIRDIRQLYGLAPHGSNEIDFEFSRPDSSQHQRKPQPKGHVVAVRITAENPDAGFKPSSGSLQELNFRSSTNVWGYFSVNSAGGLHEFADSQFGHIFAYGGDREESRKNMVVALKELSIRGDFRTTVEYLIKLLETSAFTENIFTTGWLDTLISENLTAERPDSTLAVICGAVTKAHVASEACWSEYRRILDKGQVPARDTIKTVFRFDFIYEGVRYPFTATRSSLTTWSVYLNGGRTTVGARPLADGGLLVLLDGKSHSVYWREEVGAVRLMIDAKTCLIEQENDPTQLLSPSPGKLVRFLVESGDHLRAGDTYAEIEVMKMYMPLVASEDGVPTFIKQAGVSLEPGDVIGILELDDPTRVKHAKPFEGQLPPLGAPTVVGSKPHQVLASNLSTLHNILDGFDNQNIMNSTLKELLEVLRSPELPYSDANAILSTLSGRMPPKLDESIRSAIERASTGGQEFPAARIKKLIEAHLADLKPQDRTMTRSQLASLIDVAERFRHGLKAHEWLTIASLLSRYEQTEKLFGGDIEARVLKLREEHKDDLNVVAQLVLSHIKAPSKNKLILALLDLIKEGGAAALNPETTLTEALTSLAALESRSTNPVSLKAREVLILCQLPSYDERAVQMEAVLKQSASPAYYGEFRNNQGDPNLEVLKELTDSRWIVFDVLPTFFSHSDTNIIFASLAVYVRRAYRAYSVLTIDYEEGDGMDDGDAPHVVTWRFKLGQSSSPPSTPRINEQNMSKHRQGSVSDLSYLILKNETQPLRTGAMASFPDLQALRKGFDKIVGYLPTFDPSEGVEPPNVLNIALRVFNEKDDLEDTVWREKFLELSNERKEIMNEHGTPEYPDGRRLVVVANDITFRIGSFGPKEDDYFYLASQYARKHGVPRIYLSANSGARIGVAEEVLNLFSCAWNTPGQPEKGVNYLYLTPEAESKLREMGGQSVRTQEIEDEGETRYKITDIIGLQDGLGVECLKGSGLIAGETSRAYDDIFTITLVTARSVGIGAYLVRLGQRAVQVEGQPIILTGAPALNKVLGREVYTSNLQLGGTQIMYKNGVSHMTAGSDLEGATHILRWLSYVPEHRSGPLPVTVSRDAWDRDIDYVPPKGPYDPRWFIEGKRDEISSEWMSGFFDEGSFQETLSGWAQTVVIGRARLGGIPMGIIAVETRTIERIVPADPANAASFEQRIMEAGQVWYPNSAHKTAQAIFDFNREQLPLIIFANWRGFSGGQQDMYDEVLKYGSKIVDGLSSYKQPIFVYIVPNGELRGGAWVVLDPSINPTHMQMYADVESRAGVLEPEGIVEIKLRKDKLVALMERTDPTYATHKKASKDSSLSAEERAAATSELSKRESDLMPTYKQIALLYADLHDRTGRMEAKGCAKPVQWKNARRHFHWAVRAQLAISAAVAKLLAASPQMTTEEAKQRVFAQIPQVSQQDDRALTEAVEGLDLSDVIAQVTSSHLTQQLMALVHSHRKVGFAGLVGVVNALTDEEKAAFAVALQTATPPGS
ncbi:acetyl-coenzyme-A carboxylase [Serendipita sp. 405]|nr:acetyl-coenzyme-A carboxylase [Serendipita sp. 405]